MTSNTIYFNATVCFSLNLTVTPVTRGSPSGCPSAANIHLDGQFQFSANIRVDMDGPSVPNPEAWISRWNDRPFWESLHRKNKRVIPPVRARVHPGPVPEDWVSIYIDNEPRTFYSPVITEGMK
ncbi:hypothetical protein BASA62_004561 [Batrachochytrium salamandrivorans]|nr:hypothetical protein BASA62_004561 [Batrachochytrium salamandrivorans]